MNNVMRFPPLSPVLSNWRLLKFNLSRACSFHEETPKVWNSCKLQGWFRSQEGTKAITSVFSQPCLVRECKKRAVCGLSLGEVCSYTHINKCIQTRYGWEAGHSSRSVLHKVFFASPLMNSYEADDMGYSVFIMTGASEHWSAAIWIKGGVMDCGDTSLSRINL